MADKLGLYSPRDLEIFIAFVYEIKGFSRDRMINLQKEVESFKVSTGGHGNTERLKSSNNNYTLTLSLAQTSSSNSILSALYSLDSVSRRAVFPIFIKETPTGSIFISDSCFILKPPEVVYSGNIETRDWTLYCPNMSFNLSGDTSSNPLSQVASIAGWADKLNSLRG